MVALLFFIHYSQNMERDNIEASVASLPASRLGEIQADHQIWEETDGGAKFKVTRHMLPVNEDVPIISLSVSGEQSERARLISEFCAIYGEPEPEARETFETDDGPIDIVVWLAG
jgi:hypothetical protein